MENQNDDCTSKLKFNSIKTEKIINALTESGRILYCHWAETS